MKLILEKGRKGDPIGTEKQMGKKGYWFKKMPNGKWAYMGQGKKAGEFKFRRSTVTRNDEVKKELEWLVGSLPSREYIEQEILKRFQEHLPNGIPAYVKTVLEVDMGIKSLKELASVAQGEHEDWTTIGSKLHAAFGKYQFSASLSREEQTAWSFLSQFYSDMNRVTYLSDPNFDGKLEVSGVRATKNGLSVSYYTNVGNLPPVIVSYGKLQEWAEAWISNDKLRKSTLTRLKKKSEYKRWTVEHDPGIKGAITDFTKMTGLTVEAESGGRSNVQLKESYIKKLTKVFGQLKAGFDIKRFVPQDGMSLIVRVTGAGKKYAGYYLEQDKSINIAPSKPGTISHEVGHYLWYRGGQALETEFMGWAEDSGLMDKIKKTTRYKMSEAEREQHINHTFNSATKNAIAMMKDHTGRDVNNEVSLSESAENGLQVLTSIMRQRMVDDPASKLGKFGVAPVRTIRGYQKGDLWTLVDNAQAKGMFPGEDSQSLKDQLMALTNNMNKLDGFSREALANALRYMIQDAQAGTRDPTREYFQQKPRYWEEPTEIFARTFRNYIAMKSGREIYENTDDERRAQPKASADALGWGFPEVDPTKEMLEYDNGALQKLLKKHLGETVVKSMMTMMMQLNKGRKADPEGIVKKMGKYWYKKVGKKWVYQGQGEKPGEFKFQRKSSMVSELSVGTSIEVDGVVGEITNIEGEWLTMKFKDRKGSLNVRTSRVTKVIGNSDPKVVDKAIKKANPDNRAAKVAEVVGADLSDDKPKELHPFTPTETELIGESQHHIAKDYTAVVSKDVHLVSAKHILERSRPDFIPEIDEKYFASSCLYRVCGLKTEEDQFIVQVNKREYAVVTGSVLAATQDYYMKLAKEKYKVAFKDLQENIKKTIPALEQKLKDEQAAGKDTWHTERLLEEAHRVGALKKPGRQVKRYSIGKAPRTLGSNKMSYEQSYLIREFAAGAYRDNKRWEILRTFVEELGQKMLDASAQFDEDLGSYSKGEETSYGNKGTVDILLDSHGVKVKRQNGDEITKAEVGQIKEAMDLAYSLYGDKSSLAKRWGLKISHSGVVMMHARKAIGLFFPHFRAIGVSFGGDGKLTMTHEFAHFMDYIAGGENGFHYKSDDWRSPAGQIARIIQKKSDPLHMEGYWGRSCECFARSCEAYAAYKMGKDPTTVHPEHMPSGEVLINEVFPLIEHFLDENAQVLKATIDSQREELRKLTIIEKATRYEMEVNSVSDERTARAIAMDHLEIEPEYEAHVLKAYGDDDDEDDDDGDESELDKEVEKEQRNEENKDKNEKAKLLKAKKMAIGATSADGKRKKVAEGKWVDVPKGSSKRTAFEPRVGLETPIGTIVAERGGMWAVRPIGKTTVGGPLAVWSTQDLKEEVEHTLKNSAFAEKQFQEGESARIAQEKRDSLHGFTDLMTSIRAGKVKSFLLHGKGTRYHGVTYNRPKDFAEKLIEEGRTEIFQLDDGSWNARVPGESSMIEVSSTLGKYIEHVTAIKKSLLTRVRLMMKAKPYPEGTVRSWKGGKYKKTAQGWVRVSGGKTDQERGAEETQKETAQKETKKKRDPKETAAAADNFKGYHARMKEKYGTDKLQDKMTATEKTKYNKLQDTVSGKIPAKKKLEGSKEMLSALNKVANSKKPVFMDDLEGKQKQVFNALTKEGLVSWRHMGSDEYRAELTEAGIAASEGAAALKQKGDRAKEEKQKQSVQGLSSWTEGTHVHFMRDIIREIDKTQPRSKVASGTDKKKAAFLRARKKEMQEQVTGLLEYVTPLPDKKLYRGTENQKWLHVQPGEEISLGLGSFSRGVNTAYSFSGGNPRIVIMYQGPPTEGIDIEKTIASIPESNKLMTQDARDMGENEEEIALRAPKIQVVKVESKMQLASAPGTVTLVTVKAVPMQKARKETKKDREALMEELYRDFDTPMRSKKKRGKKKS